jgi:hypothetical protein
MISMPFSQESIQHLRSILFPEYERDVKEFLAERYYWKRQRDTIEVSSKVLGGVSTIIAFASSSVQLVNVASWLSFTAGALMTTSLVLQIFASYSAGISRQRTQELNIILKTLGITPIPQIVSSEADDRVDASPIGATPSSGPQESGDERV